MTDTVTAIVYRHSSFLGIKTKKYLEYIEHIMVQGHFEASYWFYLLAPPHRVFMSLDKAN